MDLEGRLLTHLGDYEPKLDALARFRDVVYDRKADDPESLQLVDQLCVRYLLGSMENVLPEDESGDEATFRQLPRISKLFEALKDLGYRCDGDELITYILSWAAAQSYGRWRQAPWRTVLNVLEGALTDDETGARGA